MTTLTESDLQITINENVVNAHRFDDRASHGLSHCMSAVDFVVELTESYLFIEIKDPQAPHVPDRETSRFYQRFVGEQLDEEFKYKYRDSFLYEWASGRANKPIHYLVLIGLDFLTKAELARRTVALGQKLPLLGPEAIAWARPVVESCSVFNISSWNETFPRYPVTRLSVGAQV